MLFRIESAQGKVSYIALGYVVGICEAVGFAMALGWPTAAALVAISVLAWVSLGARMFRGDNETLATPRAWWRMTARPRSGFLLAIVFLSQGAYLGVTSGQRIETELFLAMAALNALIAAAYLHSSVRLRAVVDRSAAAARS
ncbi:hypothetical protein JF66_15190 [Cryobacterium sp. MLB-32]|uniref:hypothetical protein n=1 Tax=Cryobacterium sp. MLB-32 TaxID=1529318 RepID=UPI0004E769B2|nr:hypothetical protein [Cryobacterium sp. MLB-32]KFF58889.1 hypothetical protein JF66_15190 [Cryobacterium sp. MLB-32]